MRGLGDREDEGGRDLREAIEDSESAVLGEAASRLGKCSQEHLLLTVDIRQPRGVLAEEPSILSTV